MISSAATQPPIVGTVLAVQANFYRVQLVLEAVETPFPQAELLCTRRARLKKMGQQVMVGDRVLIEEPDWQGQRGAISEVLPRCSELERPPVANADQVLLMFAMADPVIDVYQLSRFLVAIEGTRLKILIGLSKADLVSTEVQKDWCDRLLTWGYTSIPLSIQTGIGIESIRQQLQNKITVLAGPSGVGKSSLINTLAPDLTLRVGEISEHWRKGKHTTRHVELFELPNGGLFADTPGFSQPTIHCLPERLIYHFPEGRSRLAAHTCQFTDCLHRDEPNCAVSGDWERYGNYLEFLDEVTAAQTERHQTRNPEARTKRKTNRMGNDNDEPMLEFKRYRRTSRKTQQQSLEKMYDDLQE
jgi:ribosome biogenesis GTPase / thiamine phosphate phosphatase